MEKLTIFNNSIFVKCQLLTKKITAQYLSKSAEGYLDNLPTSQEIDLVFPECYVRDYGT